MNIRVPEVLKKLSYTVISNFLNFLVSALITFVTPRFLGVEQFSYFQLYLFYVTYNSAFQFGWGEGIVLRYGGAYFDKLDKPKFSGQFWFFSFVEFIVCIGICLSSLFFDDINQAYVLFLLGICMMIMLPRVLLLHIITATNRIKEYAWAIYIEKIFFVVPYAILLFIGVRDFQSIVICDIFGKFAALLYALYCCKSIIKTKPVRFTEIYKETIENIRVGIKLLFANLASMLIIGCVRMGIKHSWDISTFGKISLTLNVSNLLMVFIRSVSTVLFPLLKRMDNQKLPSLYSVLRNLLMVGLFFMLNFYYPMKVILSMWLPQYSESLNYMAMLFPLCLYASKMSMLVETYMKALRQEKVLLFTNITAVICSFFITIVTTILLKNLNLAVLSIVVLVALRCIIAELSLTKVCDIKVKTDILIEAVMTVIFISSNWFVGGWIGAFIFLISYVIYVIIKKKEVNIIVENIKVFFGIRK